MTTFDLKAQVFYTDGTSSVIQTPLAQTTSLAVGTAVQYPAGFETLGLDALEPAKTPDYYELWIDNGDGIRQTEKRRYYLREREFNEVDLWFVDSLGKVEAVALRSGFTHGIRVEKDEYQRFLPYNTDNKVHEIAVGEVNFTDEYEVSTGYMSLKELRPYIDLVLSKYVWWIKDGQQIPVIVPSGQYSIVKESENEGVYDYALNIKFVKAFNNQSFSDTND